MLRVRSWEELPAARPAPRPRPLLPKPPGSSVTRARQHGGVRQVAIPGTDFPSPPGVLTWLPPSLPAGQSFGSLCIRGLRMNDRGLGHRAWQAAGHHLGIMTPIIIGTRVPGITWYNRSAFESNPRCSRRVDAPDGDKDVDGVIISG